MAQTNPPAAVGLFQETVQVANVAVSLTAAATTNVWTVPANKRFFLTSVTFHDPTADVHSTTVNVGSSGTSATNFLSAQALTGLSAAGSTYSRFSATAGATILGGGDVVQVAVNSNGVSGASVSCDVLGYFL